MFTKQKTVSYIPFSEAIYTDNLLYLNDTEQERSIRIRDKYVKALFLYYNGATDIENIILSYLMWGIKIGDLIDVRDYCNKWYVSIVLKYSLGQVFIHYVGWRRRWDEWVNISNMAFAGEISNGRFYQGGNYEPGSINHDRIISNDQKMIGKISKYVINSYIDQRESRFIFATIKDSPQ